MKRLTLLAAMTAFAAAEPALSVGLGPLAKEGVTGGPAKAFYLTLINPYDEPRTFQAKGFDLEGNQADRIRVSPSLVRMAPKSERRLIVVAGDLEPGEDFTFRVCAEQAGPVTGRLHARVCSRLRARRIAPRP